MTEKSPELKVVSCNSRGRRRYDKASKRALVEACLRPGVSIVRQAQENGFNANLLPKWIAQYLLERERAITTAASIEAVAPEQNADLPDMPEGPASANLYSLVETCKANGIDPYRYLLWLFKVASGHHGR